MRPSKFSAFHSAVSTQVGGVSGTANASFTVPAGCIFRGYYGGNTSVASISQFYLLQGSNIYGYPDTVTGNQNAMSGLIELPPGSYIVRNATPSAINSAFVIGNIWKVA